jgi:hypothetical protein
MHIFDKVIFAYVLFLALLVAVFKLWMKIIIDISQVFIQYVI